MSDDSNIPLENTIKAIEDFYFGKSGDCGLNLFREFAMKYESNFVNSNISDSTENKFEFMEIHKNYQTVLEQKLETIIIKSGINVNQFYLSLKSRCDEGDQEILIFVEIMNAVLDYNAFVDMMSNYLLNKK